jgi:hypothetical protein
VFISIMFKDAEKMTSRHDNESKLKIIRKTRGTLNIEFLCCRVLKL